MKLDQLRAFIAVVETGSFRSAADAIHKTQPSISAAVKALEEQYNMALFDRGSYRPTLTSQGRTFFQQAKKLMSQAQQLEHLGHDLAQGEQEPLRLCMSQISLTDQSIEKIKGFQLTHPSIALDLTTDHLYGVQDQLFKNKVDIAIGPRYGLDDKHAFIELMQIEMMTVIAPHRLKDLQTSSSLVKSAALNNFPHILVTNNTSHLAAGHRYTLPTGQRWYVNDFYAKKTLLLHGLGWARMPRHMIETELQQGLLVAMDVEDFTSYSKIPVFMIRLRQQTLSYQANLFWQAIKNTL